jgi:hypothetical protein
MIEVAGQQKGRGMVKVETTLSKEQFIRLSIWRHIQRRNFYFYAITCAVVSAYALTRGVYILLPVVWIPFILYLAFGIIGAFRDSADENQPYFLPTQYEFTDRGVSVRTKQGSSELTWDKFTGWNKIAQCYVLVLTGGPILAIPQSAVPTSQIVKLESLLRNHIEG